jgi:tRNA1Val (adenine37-N6)-methyltransferase
MKVGTDGVLLGAWVNTDKAGRILDIGTGTGLIALMMAQKSVALIDAVEIDESAYLQAIENIKASSWKGRINIYKESFQNFAEKTTKQYDIIVSNPPFFSKSLKPGNQQRHHARHDTNLPLAELSENAPGMLKKSGCLNLILPFPLKDEIIKNFETNGLFLVRKQLIRPKPNKPAKRILLEFSKIKKPLINEKDITIEKDKRHDYTKEYIELTKEFYLNF